MKKSITLSLFIAFIIKVSAQSPNIEWQKSLGGTGSDECYSMTKTIDSGYIVAGYSDSISGDVTTNHGGADFWVAKLNSTGSIQWQKSYGGSGDDKANNIISTIDGGYIIAGYSTSTNGDVTGNHGAQDGWVVKISSTGTIQWQKSYGGSGTDYVNMIIQTADGGYALGASTQSNDGDVTGSHGDNDFWIVKITSTGTIQWQKTLGGSNWDDLYTIIQTTDSGYAVAGTTFSNNGDVTGNHGIHDYWVVKLDTVGSIQWQKTLGGSGRDGVTSMIQLVGGGYLVMGGSDSTSGDVTGNHGGTDGWVVKLNSSGILQWQKSFGGTGSDITNSATQNADGGFTISGFSNSNDNDATGNHGVEDFWIIKIDSTGSILWKKSLGGSNFDGAGQIIKTDDGGYIISGLSSSNDGDVSGNHGQVDYWIVKLSPDTAHIINSVSPIETPQTEILLYPNPASTKLFIEPNGIAIEQVNIYNTTGSLVSQTKESQNKSIDISQLSAGVYIAEIKTKEGSAKKRWVKM